MASQPGELTLSLPSAESTRITAPVLEPIYAPASSLPAELIEELWLAADAETCSLTRDEFAAALNPIGANHNCGLPSQIRPNPSQQAAFYRDLRLPELALAQACALGHEAAWQRFLKLYRPQLTQAAIAITGSATLGHDLADSLYANLYGLSERGGRRNSPLASYSGRGSLLGWLRTTLAQRHIDHHRRTHRESPLDDVDPPAPAPPITPIGGELDHLTHAVQRTLAVLPAEDSFLLTSYFLDQRTLQQIARLLKVHEATISRRLKRLTGDLRKQLLQNLQARGLSKRAAEEALGADPRDLELNLRALLQTCPPTPFSVQTQPAPKNSPQQGIAGSEE